MEQKCQQRALLPKADSGSGPHTGQDSSLVQASVVQLPGDRRTEGLYNLPQLENSSCYRLNIFLSPPQNSYAEALSPKVTLEMDLCELFRLDEALEVGPMREYML